MAYVTNLSRTAWPSARRPRPVGSPDVPGVGRRAGADGLAETPGGSNLGRLPRGRP